MTNLNRLGIAELFEVVADLGDVSEPKPSPEIYLTVTSRLRFSRPNAWWWKTL